MPLADGYRRRLLRPKQETMRFLQRKYRLHRREVDRDLAAADESVGGLLCTRPAKEGRYAVACFLARSLKASRRSKRRVQRRIVRVVLGANLCHQRPHARRRTSWVITQRPRNRRRVKQNHGAGLG